MRVDVPTLQCDHCKRQTQDMAEMGKFRQLTGMWHGYQGHREQWDLCPSCWADFQTFMGVGGQ